MAIRIVDIKIKTNYNHQNIRDLNNWNTVKDINSNWQNLLQTTIVGQPITIEVEITEDNWLAIKDKLKSWTEIKSNFTNWLGLKNW